MQDEHFVCFQVTTKVLNTERERTREDLGEVSSFHGAITNQRYSTFLVC